MKIILITGKPHTGKTLLAKKIIANEKFTRVSNSDFEGAFPLNNVDLWTRFILFDDTRNLKLIGGLFQFADTTGLVVNRQFLPQLILKEIPTIIIIKQTLTGLKVKQYPTIKLFLDSEIYGKNNIAQAVDCLGDYMPEDSDCKENYKCYGE